MDNNANKKLENILSSLDKNKVFEAKQSIQKFLNTPDGKNIAKQISNIDKNKLMNMFLGMNSNELKQKLQNADISNLSQKDLNDIINKLKWENH